MVQPPRLKRNIHPLVPIISVLLLISGFLFLYSKPLQEKLFDSYGSYKKERNVLVDQYNQAKLELSTTISLPYSKISEYRLNLTKALALNNNVGATLVKIKDLDSKAVKNFGSVQESLDGDLSAIANNELLSNLIDNKLAAIDVYQSILSFDKCLREVKSSTNIEECKILYKNIKSPANLSSEYKNFVSGIFLNLSNSTKSQRTSMINKLVPHHNKMINNLEVIINSSITL